MLPSTRNGSGTLRSDIYYSTVFWFIKLVSTKFFKKSCLQPLFRLKTSPCPVVSAGIAGLDRICDYLTRFFWIHIHFSQKIDRISH